jgi:hypothetical protein
MAQKKQKYDRQLRLVAFFLKTRYPTDTIVFINVSLSFPAFEQQAKNTATKA